MASRRFDVAVLQLPPLSLSRSARAPSKYSKACDRASSRLTLGFLLPARRARVSVQRQQNFCATMVVLTVHEKQPKISAFAPLLLPTEIFAVEVQELVTPLGILFLRLR